MALTAQEKMVFKNVPLVHYTKIIPINHHSQFLQSLVDRMTARLCSDSDNNGQLLQDISVLNPKNTEPNVVRYGETKVKRQRGKQSKASEIALKIQNLCQTI
ncbi:hypothetical protein JTE90_018073 [Oedothorax gibbosus]|uniref:Uncharacterized protein n=1 Tax=Oedothorax gibbosus TaxID=931172 RepID=A0AAV6UDN7_9ARAC|nr:hypothetical protein JTE90_018073 [Oedothorax gibbosus]